AGRADVRRVRALLPGRGGRLGRPGGAAVPAVVRRPGAALQARRPPGERPGARPAQLAGGMGASTALMSDDLRPYLEEGGRRGRGCARAVPRRAARGAAGGGLSSRAGSSLEFKDPRPYEPGDDLRRLDWNAYARSDQLTVKVYREEVHPHVEIAVDG